ncbi:MAG: preprotein translocase subunit SecE [Elusimicrobia bacterium]|nr:preprotein translocase subunit SecE [Candidatus Obscuribacterium magneticum]
MNKLITFVKEAWAELKQVAWLTVPQMIASTGVVVVLVIIVAIYIFCVDRILHFILKAFLA